MLLYCFDFTLLTTDIVKLKVSTRSQLLAIAFLACNTMAQTPLQLDYAANTYLNCECLSADSLRHIPLASSSNSSSTFANTSQLDIPPVCQSLQRLGAIGSDAMESSQIISIPGRPSSSNDNDAEEVSSC